MGENSDENVGRILLEGDFFIHSKFKFKHHVTVTASQITYIPKTINRETSEYALSSANNSRRSGSMIGRRSSVKSTSDLESSLGNYHAGTISFDDIIGCDCQKGRGSDQSNFAYLCIYWYPHRRQLFSKVTLRRRTTLTLTFDNFSSFGENFQDGLRWKHVLGCLLNKFEPDGEVNTWPSPPERKFLVLVNPFSGPGKALKIFQERIFPMFAEAQVKHHMVLTKHAGHAKEIVKSLFIDDWYGIIIVSGDGLIHETINGLMERHDWDRALKIPIGALPGGSGNAMAAAVLHSAGEPYQENFVCHSTFSLIKHKTTPMDLLAVDLGSSKRLYSVLAIAWGIISDVDIGSEKYRSLGNSRFAVEAVAKIASLRKYRGRLSFLPVGSFTPKTGFRFVQPTNQPNQTMTNDVRSSTLNENTNTKMNNLKLSDNYLATTESEIVANVNQNSTNRLAQDSQSFDISNSGAHNVEINSGSRIVPTPFLPKTVNDPIPSDWLTVEDEFVTVIASLQTHLSMDSIVAPTAHFDDGLIHLAYVQAGISRLKLIQMFFAMEEGRVIDDPHVEIVPVRAFRLVPLTEGGTLTVDGELVDYGPVQAQVLPSIACIMK